MAAILEEPKIAPTGVKPPNPNIPAESPADRFREGNTGNDANVSLNEFSKALTGAQVKDGTKPQSAAPEPREEPAPAPAPHQEPATKPTVPALPQAEEWRPKGEKAGEKWDKLIASHREAETRWNAERDLLRKEVEAARSNSGPAVEEMRKQVDQYREIVKGLAIERDPEFQKAFQPKEKAAIDAAVQAAGDKGDKLGKLLAAPRSDWRDEQVSKILEDLPASGKRRAEAALMVLEQVDVERTAEIARRRATFEESQSAFTASQQQRDAARAKMMDEAFQETEKNWKLNHPFFVEKKGDDAHNAEVANSIALAKAIYSGDLEPKELAQASMWAASGERVLKGWQAAIKRAEEAEKALDKIRGVQPGGGREDAQHEEGGERPPDPTSPQYLKWMNNKMREAQAKDIQGRR